VPGAGGISICSCTSSFDNTASGLYGTSPAPQNSAQAFSAVNVFSKAALTVGRNMSLLMWWMLLRAKSDILLPW
jgi:hypothetical protein